MASRSTRSFVRRQPPIRPAPVSYTHLTLPRIALAFLPALVFGSVLYQSGALALVYGGASKQAFFLAQLASRSVQFAVTGAADILIVWMLGRSGVFSAVRLWPPVAVTGSERA